MSRHRAPGLAQAGLTPNTLQGGGGLHRVGVIAPSGAGQQAQRIAMAYPGASPLTCTRPCPVPVRPSTGPFAVSPHPAVSYRVSDRYPESGWGTRPRSRPHRPTVPCSPDQCPGRSRPLGPLCPGHDPLHGPAGEIADEVEVVAVMRDGGRPMLRRPARRPVQDHRRVIPRVPRPLQQPRCQWRRSVSPLPAGQATTCGTPGMIS